MALAGLERKAVAAATVDGAIREGRRVDAGLGEGSRRREKAGEARERWRVVVVTTAENEERGRGSMEMERKREEREVAAAVEKRMKRKSRGGEEKQRQWRSVGWCWQRQPAAMEVMLAADDGRREEGRPWQGGTVDPTEEESMGGVNTVVGEEGVDEGIETVVRAAVGDGGERGSRGDGRGGKGGRWWRERREDGDGKGKKKSSGMGEKPEWEGVRRGEERRGRCYAPRAVTRAHVAMLATFSLFFLFFRM